MQSTRIECVVVLYQCTLDKSKTIQSLITCLKHDSRLADQLSVLVYDNSPMPQRFDGPDRGLGQSEYRHDATNGGLAAAYNHALALAQEKQIDWLLLLDQDTVVGPQLFIALLRQIAMPADRDICAVVPRLVQGRTILSPQIVGKIRNCSVATTFAGVSPHRVTALNSGACLRVTAVVGVGGFPKEYWLEYLDHIMFSRLQADGGKVLILDVTIQHQLSLLNLDTEMSLSRYTNVLAAEWRFVRETGCWFGPLVHRLRLLKRSISHTFKLRNKTYALQTFLAAFNQSK